MREYAMPVLKVLAACVLLALSVSCGTGSLPQAIVPQVGRFSAPISDTWSAPQAGVQTPYLSSITEVIAKAKPSVVAINAEVVTYDILQRPTTTLNAGSGWIIDESGIIITNNHVVEGADKVIVTLDNGQAHVAESFRTDPLTDIAVVKVNAHLTPAVRVSDTSSLRVGDWVVSIGNPLGLGISAKQGIVSRIGVSISVSEGQTLYDLIETSAAINPGNSGGPLVNMAGEVVGMTSAKIATVGVEGMGYAINVNHALPIVEMLVRSGCVVRPWLGVDSVTVDRALMERYGLAVDKGALVTGIVAGGPADRAGIKRGDVIISFQGQKINGTGDLLKAEHINQIGQTVTISLQRGRNKMDFTVTLAESPPCKY